ncbi:MAG TPA: MBOAT family protein [Chthoniobacteraceae bacterium]|nr:MBOAT family protein [Chthoniobacteraceae bacterium]
MSRLPASIHALFRVVFSSHIFIYYFLPVMLLGYYALYRAPQRWRNFWLIVTGYLFYGWAEPRFVPLMFFTTSIDWLMSLVIAHNTWRVWRHWRAAAPLLTRGDPRSRLQRGAITTSIVLNLAVLGFFKYFNFGVDSCNALLSSVGAPGMQWDTALRVVLPLGISFYTFQALSYTIDVYRGDAEAMTNFIDFSCFVSMVPHLVAGPILKFSFLADQLKHRTLTLDKFARGSTFFMLGLAKKILLANPCGKVADTLFDAASVHTLDAWFGAVAYAFQIYFDFSGYSDMAIGLGLMLGFVFAKNFDSPYRAESITDFWRRWHISLSTWLREYLYIPLGGNRRGLGRTYANLIVTMLLGGLWHGASWTFVIWGGLHGVMLALEKKVGLAGLYARVPRAVRIAVTFVVVLIGWVFFRASSLHKALTYLASMFGLHHAAPPADLIAGIVYKPYYLLSLGGAAIVVWAGHQTWDWTQRLTLPKVAVCFSLAALALVALAGQEYNPFIYFIF